ncbi:MAG: IS30 family transposase [Gammaproteobacteria bacterium]|nr:IS30 family transposase [Gammaproteobacteria bacterium]
MPFGYHPLTYAERCQIHGLKKSGLSIRGMAHQRERSPGRSSATAVDGKTAEAVTGALLRRLEPVRDRVLTLTADHGKEFAGHRAVSAALAADFYLATPYHSWERGLNEHTHGLVRQYLPKKTDLRGSRRPRYRWSRTGSTTGPGRSWATAPPPRGSPGYRILPEAGDPTSGPEPSRLDGGSDPVWPEPAAIRPNQGLRGR